MKHLITRLIPALGFALAAAAASAAIADHAVRSTIAGLDVIACPTGVQDVVTLRGNLPGGDAYATDNPAIPSLTAMMLSRGTTAEDKYAIAKRLEDVGATITFSSDQQMLSIQAKCLKQDTALVIGLLAEQLRHPAFSAEEFAKAKTQFAGEYRRQIEDPEFMAENAFGRAIYPAGHPNRPAAPDAMQAGIQNATLEQVKAFYQRVYGPAHGTLVIVGDLSVPAVQQQVTQAFSGWTGGADLLKAASAQSQPSREETVFIPEKTSVNVIIGSATGLRYPDADALALRAGTAILGSGFTGRLMANVRDKMGLTYGIYATVSDDTFCDGDWRMIATYNPQLMAKGIAATRAIFADWHDHGVTAKELARAKTDLIGSFKVSLSTTEGMAGALLAAVNRGYGVDWLDRYPQRIDSLTLGQVNAAINKHLDPARLIMIEAGTVLGAQPAPAAAK